MFRKNLFLFLGILVTSVPAFSATLTAFNISSAAMVDSGNINEQYSLWSDGYIQVCGPHSRNLVSSNNSTITLTGGGGGGVYDASGKQISLRAFMTTQLTFDSAGCSQKLFLSGFSMSTVGDCIGRCSSVYYSRIQVTNIPFTAQESSAHNYRIRVGKGNTYQQVVNNLSLIGLGSADAGFCSVSYPSSIHFDLVSDSPEQLHYVMNATGSGSSRPQKVKYEITNARSVSGWGNIFWHLLDSNGAFNDDGPVFRITEGTLAGSISGITPGTYYDANSTSHSLRISRNPNSTKATMAPGQYSSIVTITLLCQ